jgi:ribosomal protein L29
MKKQERQKLHRQKKNQLENRLKKTQEEAVAIRMKKGVGKQKDVHAYKKKRKEIAIIATIIREKNLLEKVKKGEK